MTNQGAWEGPTPRNTVTLSLDGAAEEVLNNYRRCQDHFRSWNRSRGIIVDVSGVYGGQREIYTAPSSGTFYHIVRYWGRKLTFVIEARSGWLTGFYGRNGRYEMQLEDQDIPYMNTDDCQRLSFRGNHRFISDGSPGSTLIGLYSLRNAFNAIWEYRGINPEPANFRRAIGIFVVHLCEAAKIQPIFDGICSSFLDHSISRLDSESGTSVGELCESWSFLCTEGMKHVHYRFIQATPPAINNRGIKTVSRAEDILEKFRILHRDAYDEGVFIYEPIPSPPHHWEPIDPGNGDSDDAVDFDDDEDSDGGGSDGKGKSGRK